MVPEVTRLKEESDRTSRRRLVLAAKILFQIHSNGGQKTAGFEQTWSSVSFHSALKIAGCFSGKQFESDLALSYDYCFWRSAVA